MAEEDQKNESGANSLLQKSLSKMLTIAAGAQWPPISKNMSDFRNDKGSKSNGGNGKSSALWGKIGAGAVGGILLALQGLNLSELGNVADAGNKRAESLKIIEQEGMQRAKALEGIAQSIEQNSEILKNGTEMLRHDSDQLENQRKILDLLERNLEAKTSANPSPPK
jgi:hypothetical protein